MEEEEDEKKSEEDLKKMMDDEKKQKRDGSQKTFRLPTIIIGVNLISHPFSSMYKSPIHKKLYAHKFQGKSLSNHYRADFKNVI